jgi:hypothetical protein
MIEQAIHTAFNSHLNGDCEENVFIPLATRIQDYLHYWNQEGSFNVDLYLKICQIKKMNNG